MTFTHLAIIEPLGLLYGSSGRFLSPENLVGRSGKQFPPTAATLSGLFASQLSQEKRENDLRQLQLAGPFWSYCNHPQNIHVPTPYNCFVKNQEIVHQLAWDAEAQKWLTQINGQWETPPDDKYSSDTWFAIEQWEKLHKGENNLSVTTHPWKFLPHLHPRLEEDQRRVIDPSSGIGSLFLENSVQLDPDTCLVYLSNTAIPDGCYRFGGEGHLVDLRCEPIQEPLQTLLNLPLGRSFALITAAVWGSTRQSYRSPTQDKEGNLLWGDSRVTLFTQRCHPIRYRLGEYDNHLPNQPKILSRGRYAVPAGTVYVLETPLDQTWDELPESLFPTEGVSFKRWGSGLALPLNAICNMNEKLAIPLENSS